MLSNETRIQPFSARSGNGVTIGLRVAGHIVGRGLKILVDLFEAVVFDWPERARERHNLAKMDERMLRDIGLSRADVDKELRKRPWNA